MVRAMFFVTRKPFRIRGVDIPRRRFTVWAAIYFLAFVCVPVLGVALVLDFLLYLLFERVFGLCYAILCLFG